jgi:hypothetical protein
MFHGRIPSGFAMFSAILLLLGVVIPSGRAWSAEKSTKSQAEEITELRKELAALREENRRLRKLLVENTDDGFIADAPRAKVIPVPGPNDVAAATGGKGDAAARHWLSAGGKRHNDKCRYFKGAGRACGKDEGVACKVCGG